MLTASPSLVSVSSCPSASIVGVLGYAVNRINNLSDTFFLVIFIRDGTTAGKHNLAHQLRRRRGFQLCRVYMLLRHSTGMIVELSGDKSCTKLQLVEHLPPEAVGFAVGGDRLPAGAELDNRRTILGIFVPDGLFVPVGGEDALPGQLVVGVIAVNDGIDQHFAGDHLICTERDVALGGAHNSAVLVCISILFSLHYVNRSDNKQKNSALQN